MKLSKSKQTNIDHHLPIYDPNSSIGKKEMMVSSSSSRSKSKEMLVHLIPLIVFICLFVLWCLSYPVNLEIKDGRLTAVHQIGMSQSQPVTERLVDHTVLAIGTTTNTNASIPLILTLNNNTETAPQPASETGTEASSLL